MERKFGFICGTKSWGGLEMNQLKMATQLKERKFDLTIFCKKDSPFDQYSKEKNLTIVYIEDHRRYKYFFAGLKLRSLLKKDKITHLIVRSSTDLNICSIAKTFSFKKFKLIYFMEMQLGISKKNFLHTSRFRKIDLWFCSTNFLKSQVLKFTNYPEKKIKIIPPAIDLAIFQESISKSEARKILNLPEQKIIVGLIGRIDILKGQLLLLKALKILNNNEMIVCFMGAPTLNEKNNYYDLLQNFVKENKLENQVIFLPFSDKVLPFYKAIDLCVMASKSETFGMVTIESLASGTPIMGSNAGGTTEILENGALGFLFESENETDLAEKITSFLKAKGSVDREKIMSEIKKYDSEKVVAEFENNLRLLD